MMTIERTSSNNKYIVKIGGYKLNKKEMALLNSYDKLYGVMLDKKKIAEDKMDEIFDSIKSRTKLFGSQKI